MSSNKKLKHTNIKNGNNQISATKFEVSHYEGILPPIEVIETYEKFQEGSANRILMLIENQVNSRLENEKKLLEITENTSKSEISYNFLGLIFVFVIIISILAIGFVLAFFKEKYGLLTGSVIATLLGALVKVFNKK